MSRQPGASCGDSSEFFLMYKEKSFLPKTRVGQMFSLAFTAVTRGLPSCVDSEQRRWAPILLPKVRFPRQGHAANAQRAWMHQDRQETRRESGKLQVWSVRAWFTTEAVGLPVSWVGQPRCKPSGQKAHAKQLQHMEARKYPNLFFSLGWNLQAEEEIYIKI